jgi:hypothetical protein
MVDRVGWWRTEGNFMKGFKMLELLMREFLVRFKMVSWLNIRSVLDEPAR